MQKLTGLSGPDRVETRAHQLAQQRLGARVALVALFVQDVCRIRDQPRLPDCAGEAFGAGVHGVTGFDASGRQIWREAQRRGSGSFDPEAGTLLEYAVEGIMHRGVSLYTPGEELDVSRELETWTQGHAAHDTRQVGAVHYRVGELAELYTAIASGLVVVDGGGVTAKYMQRGPAQANVPADLDEVGGNANGHAQRLPGYWLDAEINKTAVGDLILYQGSWSTNWGGCWVPEPSDPYNTDLYRWFPGCVWVRARTFAERWDCHALEVRI